MSEGEGLAQFSSRDGGGTLKGLRSPYRISPARPDRALTRRRRLARYCAVERAVGTMRVTTFFSRSSRSGTRGAISFFQWSLSYTAL